MKRSELKQIIREVIEESFDNSTTPSEDFIKGIQELFDDFAFSESDDIDLDDYFDNDEYSSSDFSRDSWEENTIEKFFEQESDPIYSVAKDLGITISDDDYNKLSDYFADNPPVVDWDTIDETFREIAKENYYDSLYGHPSLSAAERNR